MNLKKRRELSSTGCFLISLWGLLACFHTGQIAYGVLSGVFALFAILEFVRAMKSK